MPLRRPLRGLLLLSAATWGLVATPAGRAAASNPAANPASNPAASASAAKPAASSKGSPDELACAEGECGAEQVALPDPKTLEALPKLSPIEKPAVDAEGQAEFERALRKLASANEKNRLDAATTLGTAAQPNWLGATIAKVQELRGSLDRDRTPRLLEDVRKKERDRRKKEAKAEKKRRKEEGDKDKPKEADAADDDWLAFAVVHANPDDRSYKELVELLACVRILGALGTTPAVRELVAMRGYFGEFVRIDLQRQIEQLRDKAVPALIESRKHDAEIVRRFAEVQLDKLGRAIPGEAVGTSDPHVLADVLRAFGRVRDVDAVRVVLSFANHDRAEVRQAAREAITAIGEPGRWQLRDAFEDLRGEKPPKQAAWSEVAQWIFWLYDRGRRAELERAITTAFALQKDGKHAEAVAKFDDILARDPTLPSRTEMVPSYEALALETPIEKGEERLTLLRKALRLAPADSDTKKLRAQIAFTEGKLLEAQGRPDASLFRTAVELDPSLAEAKQAQVGFEERVVTPEVSTVRKIGAAGLGAIAAIAAAVALVWGRRSDKTRRALAKTDTRTAHEPPPGPATPPAPTTPAGLADTTAQVAPADDKTTPDDVEVTARETSSAPTAPDESTERGASTGAPTGDGAGDAPKS